MRLDRDFKPVHRRIDRVFHSEIWLGALLLFAASLRLEGQQRLAATFKLIAANGRDLPAVVSANGSLTQEVVSGSVTLRSDGTFAWQTLYRDKQGEKISTHQSSGEGAYEVNGQDIIFILSSESGRLRGKLSEEELTLHADVELQYRRQL